MMTVTIKVPELATNGEIFQSLFNIAPANFWAMDSRQFQQWVNTYDSSRWPNIGADDIGKDMTVKELLANLSQSGNFAIESITLVDPSNPGVRWTYYDSAGILRNTKKSEQSS